MLPSGLRLPRRVPKGPACRLDSEIHQRTQNLTGKRREECVPKKMEVRGVSDPEERGDWTPSVRTLVSGDDFARHVGTDDSRVLEVER